MPLSAPCARRAARHAVSIDRSEDGVGLISVLVVVVLLGVLAAIAITSLDTTSGSRSSAHGSPSPSTPVVVADMLACESSAKAIESAAVAYFAGHDGAYPPDIAPLTPGDRPFLKREPDPKWGLVYDNTTGTVDASGCDR